MNPINKFFLRLALLPAPLYRGAGVDVVQLRSILKVKLTMDDRRPNTFQQTRQRTNKKPVTMATIGTMLLSLLMGFFFLFSFGLGANMATHLTVYFSFFFLMLSATLISDFTSVLIDVRDNYIILPKPVNDSTVIFARLLHISIHISKIVLPMAIPGLVYMALEAGAWATLLLFLNILLVTVFAIFFINAVYILILRVTTPQRFQGIISYIQIVFAIGVYMSYQILPRMITRYNLYDLDLTRKAWTPFYPMYWFAEEFTTLEGFGGTGREWAFTAAAILLPLLSLFLVVRYLAPSFNNKLALISSASSTAAAPAAVRTQARRIGYADRLSRLLTRSHAERMGFLFSWKLSGRSRDFKMKVYPSIGYLLVYVFFIFFTDLKASPQTIANGEGKMIVVMALYLCSLLLTMGITQSVYSEKHKAAWIYFTAPIQKPGEVILGSTKASIFKFYIPIVVVLTVAGLLIAGPSILPNIILGLFNQLLISTVLVFIGHKYFPFSQHQSASQKSGSFLRGMMLLIVSGIIGVGHYFIYSILPAVILCALLSILATWLLMGSIREISWKQVRSSYEG